MTTTLDDERRGITFEACPHGEHASYCLACLEGPPPKRRVTAAPRRPTVAPTSADDVIRLLAGTKDLSVPVHDVAPYQGTDWLRANGYPHDLRQGGWLYLRVDGALSARVRVRSMGWRDERPWRTGEAGEDAGPGLVFELAPDSWATVDIDLGADAERMRQGYRYHLTAADGSVVHLTSGGPIPAGDWDAPAAPDTTTTIAG
jgi:hypothetical protein